MPLTVDRKWFKPDTVKDEGFLGFVELWITWNLALLACSHPQSRGFTHLRYLYILNLTDAKDEAD